MSLLVDPAAALRSRHRIRRIVALLVAVVFGFDLWLPSGIALGSLYVVPVLISVWGSSRRLTLAVAALASVLTPIGSHFSIGHGGPLIEFLELPPEAAGTSRLVLLTLLNSANALFAVWVSAGLGLMRIETEHELVESRELAAIALGSISDAVLTTDTAGRVTFINAPAEELTAWDREDALGRPLGEVVVLAPERRRRKPAEVELIGGEEAVRLARRDGEEILVEMRRSPILDRRGEERGQVLLLRDASERAAQEQAVLELAFRDPLTGLSNRNSLFERLELEIAHARRDQRRVALLFLDLDRFKEINDTRGHHAGDELLRRVANRLRRTLRSADTVARLGGDEFTALLPKIGSPEDALAVAQKVCTALSSPARVLGRSLAIQASVGVALYPDHARTPAELVRAADAAMYAAKRRGDGTPVLFEAGMPLDPARVGVE